MRHRLAVAVLAAAALSCLPLRADLAYYGQRATVADQLTWSQGLPSPGRPIRWTATASWFSSGEAFHAGACVLALYPFGLNLDNDWYEFPGDVSAPQSLAALCNGLAAGACIAFDVTVLTNSVDTFGQRYLVQHATPCPVNSGIFVLSSYQPNSGTADGCLSPQGQTCANLRITADAAGGTGFRSQFDAAVPGLLGHPVSCTGWYTSAGQFTCTTIPH